MKKQQKIYEAPRAEVVVIDMQANVLMGSPVVVVPDASINGNGFQFTEDQGNW